MQLNAPELVHSSFLGSVHTTAGASRAVLLRHEEWGHRHLAPRLLGGVHVQPRVWVRLHVVVQHAGDKV